MKPKAASKPMRLLPIFLTSFVIAAPIAPKKAEPQKPLTPAQKADYIKVIQPIFDAHCISCHGPKKEKGKLRLDTLEATLKGGKNPTFIIGKAESSMLLARVFLERTAGDIMPPKAEKPMTEKEKEAIYAFVEGQPIPDELSKAALADTKTAVADAKNSSKPKK